LSKPDSTTCQQRCVAGRIFQNEGHERWLLLGVVHGRVYRIRMPAVREHILWFDAFLSRTFSEHHATRLWCLLRMVSCRLTPEQSRRCELLGSAFRASEDFTTVWRVRDLLARHRRKSAATSDGAIWRRRPLALRLTRREHLIYGPCVQRFCASNNQGFSLSAKLSRILNPCPALVDAEVPSALTVPPLILRHPAYGPYCCPASRVVTQNSTAAPGAQPKSLGV